MAGRRTNPRKTEGVGPDAAARVIAALLENSDSDDAQPGLERIDGFILSRTLGEGGGGVVYLAFREGSDRPLALKVLSRRLGGHDREAKRAWRELALLHALRLPCVPRLADYGVSGGRLFIATEYVEGKALDAYCRELPRRDRAELLARVADAVQSLHEHGVIHRDIKPSNVLVDERGQVSIIDLGIATLLASDVTETLTADGAPIGSPAFMAPEQARGERANISTRTDVYGLGAAACFVLTGETPFDCTGTVHEALRKIGAELPRGSRGLDGTLPKALAAVLDKAAAGRAEDRYGSAGELAADLRRWRAGEPVLADGLRVWPTVVRWIGRHPLVTTAASCAALAVCVLCASAIALWWAGARAWTIVSEPNATPPRWAEVRSYAGWPTRRWEGAINVATEFDAAPRFGGRMFLLSVSANTGDDADNGRLLAFSARDVRQPIWTTGTGPPSIRMPTLEGFTATPRFVCEHAEPVDIFPESEGQEIVVLMHHDQWGPAVLRVYDPSGRVLYEAWHNGWIYRARWLPRPGLLVLVADNSEVMWFGRGATGVQQTWPRVVLAIRPTFGKRAGWIRTPSAPGDVEPAWYKCILPAEAVDRLAPDHAVSLQPPGAHDRSDEFELTVGSIVLHLDEHGNETRPPFVYAENNRDRALSSPSTRLRLGDLPPIDPRLDAAARPANGD
jgi:predicted Ser/Thr protein kinase